MLYHTLLPLLLLTLSATTSPLPTLTPRTTCYSGFYIIVARGSNEAAGEGEPGKVATMIEARVPNSGSVAVDYPAKIIDLSGSYPVSVIKGINDTKTKIQEYVEECGEDARIVLLGYSQGGNVMTDVLAGGVGKPAPLAEEYRNNIKGVAVFGDPTFTAKQSFDAGTSTKDGIFARRGSSLTLLNTYASVLQSYCDANDFFCASGGSLDVHYAEVDNHAQAATDFIASKA
ncbi:carbohydrate esterase family 5 protein [Pseudocercospora fijiensis CIRAD86]|uniref:Carbohydrate esterase family 5 protein n=1 Tax=Pseudocercospora fijiensis (strain CIRAD86) TaxID=383855 RepID=M3ATI2_PSEFD|nr:carbohydrate esterase family 5 protein [Pseudocercospora fijiensis CIRAD86]EME80762.1 carbohydrate esterase family 5 protein [Pseudocercospora fijiensis CIRAD86]